MGRRQREVGLFGTQNLLFGGGEVFFDPYAITDEDCRDYDGEIRYITVGMSNQNRLLKVVWTDKDPNTRLISAWRASAQDKKDYDR